MFSADAKSDGFSSSPLPENVVWFGLHVQLEDDPKEGWCPVSHNKKETMM
jgi:hypothetical protein